jgi:uncharacterized repeat protein (TIGR01451 family)
LDVSIGGSNNGSGEVANSGTFSFFETSHPLCSGDVNDFCLGAGSTVGFGLHYGACNGRTIAECIANGGAFVNSEVIDTTNPGGYGNIVISGAATPRRDLTISSTVEEHGPYQAGQTIHYVNTIKNAGASMSTSTRVLAMDRLPAGSVFRGATGDGVTCISTPPDVACEHAGLASGEQFTVRIEVRLSDRPPGNRTFTNQVEVDPKNAVTESNESNNKAQVSTVVQ